MKLIKDCWAVTWPAFVVLGFVVVFVAMVLGCEALDRYDSAHNPAPQSYSYSYSYSVDGYRYAYSYSYNPEGGQK